MENQHILRAISIVLAYGPCTVPLCESMRASYAEKAKKCAQSVPERGQMPAIAKYFNGRNTLEQRS